MSLIPLFLFNVTSHDLKPQTPREVPVYLCTHVYDNVFDLLHLNFLDLSLKMDVSQTKY